MSTHLSLVTSEPTLGQIIDAHTAPVRPRPAHLCPGCQQVVCACDLDDMERLSIWSAQADEQAALLAEIPWRF